MQLGDTVIFIENGQEKVSTVLGIRELEDHSGQNNEPMVHLGFFDQVYKPGADGKLAVSKVIGTHEQNLLANFRLDVVHVSHVFTKSNDVYPGGRWKLAEVKEIDLLTESEPEVSAESEVLAEPSPESENFEDSKNTVIN